MYHLLVVQHALFEVILTKRETGRAESIGDALKSTFPVRFGSFLACPVLSAELKRRIGGVLNEVNTRSEAVSECRGFRHADLNQQNFPTFSHPIGHPGIQNPDVFGLSRCFHWPDVPGLTNGTAIFGWIGPGRVGVASSPKCRR
jgi:hypothetical protein